MNGSDWVTARSACSIEATFQVLSEVIDSDVKAANALKRNGLEFKINTEPRGKLLVIRDQDYAGFHGFTAIVFDLSADKITVTERKGATPEARLMFSFVPSLNIDGECMYRIEGQEELLKLWQVSRKALEDLFFGS